MKRISGDIWIDDQADGTINIGFVQAFINQKLVECFHIVQADKYNVSKDGPMLTLETNDTLESIPSPVTGKVDYFNSKARNFPDQLKEEDVIIKVCPVEIAAKRKTKPIETMTFEELRVQWLGLFQEEQVQPRDGNV